jgi:hypothetical protein
MLADVGDALLGFCLGNALAKDLHAQARRPNVLIKIPGTSEGLPAIEASFLSK